MHYLNLDFAFIFLIKVYFQLYIMQMQFKYELSFKNKK